mmetsp:Transcript_41335/g.98023  ORF Transcript_41335/g.98023 Transcript_41335/m.98023 type:complete len:220 (-) Transcript_41335:828-1487(-)
MPSRAASCSPSSTPIRASTVPPRPGTEPWLPAASRTRRSGCTTWSRLLRPPEAARRRRLGLRTTAESRPRRRSTSTRWTGRTAAEAATAPRSRPPPTRQLRPRPQAELPPARKGATASPAATRRVCGDTRVPCLPSRGPPVSATFSAPRRTALSGSGARSSPRTSSPTAATRMQSGAWRRARTGTTLRAPPRTGPRGYGRRSATRRCGCSSATRAMWMS